MAELKNRFDFVFVFDVKDGNPNGDPDAGRNRYGPCYRCVP